MPLRKSRSTRSASASERRGAVGPLHRPLPVHQHQAASGYAVLVRPHAVGPGHLALRVEVGQQREVKVQVAAEGAVAERPVDRYAEQLRAALLELAQHLLVDAELVGADRAEVGRVEDQEDPAAAEVRERDLLAVLVWERELRGLRAGLYHRRSPSSWMRAR